MGIDHEYLKSFAREYYLWNGAVIGYCDQDEYYKFCSDDDDSDLSFCIPRYVFDNILYEKAIKAGCLPHKQSVSNISKFSSNFKHEFDYIIDARGILAGKCNAIAIREYWSLPLEYFPSYYHSNLQLYLDSSLGFDGYFWIFPVDLNNKLLKLNVGLGFSINGYNKYSSNLIRLFDEFIINHRIASKFLANVVSKTKKKVYPLAITKWTNKIYENNIFKVGDAANLTDPLTAEGIGNAIQSGFYLAQAINMSDNLENTKFNYQQLYREHFEKELRMRLLQYKILSFPIISNFLLEMMSNKYCPSRIRQAISGF